MINENLKKIIEGNPMALATINKDGTPHVIAIAYVKAVDDKLVITNNHMKTTIENVKLNSNVSLAVWDKKWNGFRIDGIAEYFESGKWLDFIKEIKENKNELCNGAIVVKIKVIKGLV